MADPRFFSNRGPFTLGELAARCGAKLDQGAAPAHLVQDRLNQGKLNQDRLIQDVAPLETAGPDELSFIDNPAYLPAFRTSAAGACIVAAKHAAQARPGMPLLISDQPYRAYALAAQAFYPDEIRPAAATGADLRSGAIIDPTARLGKGVVVGPGAVIEAGVEIGDRCRIGANTVIGRNVRLGADCRISNSVSLSHCEIGERVQVHPGVRIGQDGFGFAPDPKGHVKVPQLGRVLIGDDCDIGANATIDRGSGPDTVIGAGCWIDNLVQIGHNVVLGRGCVLVAQSGVSGSTKLGDFVMIGGQSGLAGHLTIGAGARIAAQAGVLADIPPGEAFGGTPAQPIRHWHRQTALLRRMMSKKGTPE